MGLRKRLKSWGIDHGIDVARTASPDRICAFINQLTPVSTNHPLVRVGSAGDGGYLLPDDLEGAAACFSPGVKDNSDFELDLAGRGIHSFLADYSVEKPPSSSPYFDFVKKYVGPFDVGNFISMNSWVQSKSPDNGDLILQMDIEGHEFQTIAAMDNQIMRRFRIMAVEFHWMNRIFSNNFLEYAELVFGRIGQYFDVVHIHPNNCLPVAVCRGIAVPPVMEFTFLRKDRWDTAGPPLRFPHPLDQPNKSGMPDLELPAVWRPGAQGGGGVAETRSR